MTLQTITIREYLAQKGIAFRESGNELITKCLLNECDKDSRNGEAHLYFNTETGQYDCKKCGAQGNLQTLRKHLGDEESRPRRTINSVTDKVEKYHQALPIHIREYLHERGLTDAVIDAYKLGYGQFYRKQWITIPIKDTYGNYVFFKLRQDPAFGNDKMTYPSGVEAQLYDWGALETSDSPLVVCEGELDRLLLISKGVLAVTSTHGAMTFNKEWAERIQNLKEVYVCFDNDNAGRKGAERTAKMVEDGGKVETFIITLPPEVGDGGDVTDYFTKLNGTVEDLFSKYAKPYPERIDTSKFTPLTVNQLLATLGLTIKHDAENKLATFLCELSAYTENAQFNISYNAPSSTGKSYIPLEISNLFPNQDVMKLGNCSPNAFFHEQGEFDKDTNTIVVDLSRKIIIFLDQPHADLLERLRSLLSHDEKEMQSKITDKNEKGGNRTKTVIIKGFPSVIFCTAGLRIDEQEATRFLLLSPEVNQEKIHEGISAVIRKEANSESFTSWLEADPGRILLKERIRAIKLENAKEINIVSPERIEKRFLGDHQFLKPRHQRDIKRLLSLIKAFALLNIWWREQTDSTIMANNEDIDAAFMLWDKISVSQELNLPPYIYDLYKDIIFPAWEEKNVGQDGIEKVVGTVGVTRQEVLSKHFAVYGRMLDTHQLRQQILPMLETAGLIIQEQDPDDKRKILIFPSSHFQNSDGSKDANDLTANPPGNNSETKGGVNVTEKLL
ncbi:MAG: toprim domain-containing protein [Patescibacteria group bacterium]|jgi:hypothetical protein